MYRQDIYNLKYRVEKNEIEFNISSAKKINNYMNSGGISFYKALLPFRLKLKGEIQWNKK